MKCIVPEHLPGELVTERELKSSDRGSVYLVRDLKNHERFIYRVFSGSGDVYRRLLGISCPYLPKILSLIEANGKAYVLEEYIQGDNLAFLIESDPLDPEFARRIMLQLCEALKVLHGIGAVHRDIKPENIIMRGSDAVLIDFDASRICKVENDTDTQIMGTTGYAAPEQYGFSQTDARTDIYAMGILLNEMLTKRHPSMELTQGKYRHVVEKCIQVNADQRYGSASDLIRAMKWPVCGPKRWISLLLGILFLILTAIPLLYGQVPEQSTEETLSEPTQKSTFAQTHVPSPPAWNLPEMEVFTRQKIEISAELWQDTTEGYATPFKCDMDGDGEVENYLFGIDFWDSPQESVVYCDINTLRYDTNPRRDVHPCVWYVKKDGTMDVAPEFAELLQNVELQIWRVDNADCEQPEAWTTDYVWPGCVQITFSESCEGTWLYRVYGDIGGYTLSAQASSTFYFERT